VSRRQARRQDHGVGLCRPCARGRVELIDVEPLLRAWLAVFSDEDILIMARGVWNSRGGSVEAVAPHRERLGVRKP
jgi:hypothetical protein